MSENKAQPDASMEQVLSAIGRIIAEDQPAAHSGPREEPLELTQAVADDGTVSHLKPPPERIVAPATAAAASASFGELSEAENRRRRAGEVPIGGSDRTLEDIVRDMMRPLLQAWLDQHLAGLVERLVREEIARLAGDPKRP